VLGAIVIVVALVLISSGSGGKKETGLLKPGDQQNTTITGARPWDLQ
jgi:hypothetical protein